MIDIKNFLLEDAIHYDFTDNCTKDNDYIEKKGYDKYFAYRTQKSAGDPDSCSKLLQDIYKVLWPELINLDYLVSNGKIISDTMTSVQYTLGRYYSDIFPNESIQYMKENPKQKFVSSLMCKNMFEQNENVNNTLKSNTNLEHFISVYHTIGNYSPVPKGFNVARSGPGASSSFDYWDLTLMKIKQYYDFRKEAKGAIDKALLQVIQLLHREEEIENCFLWLNFYSSWDEFIMSNYFQDYVDKNGEVVPFCKGHSWNSGCNEVNDYDEFFENAWRRIESRSKRMIDALKEKLKDA